MNKRTLIVLGTVVVTFFSIIVIIIGMRFAGFEGFDSEDFGPITITTALFVLTVPLLTVFLAQNFLLKEKLTLREENFLRLFAKGCLLGILFKAIAFFISTVISPPSYEFALRFVTVSEWLPFFLWFLFTLVLNSLSEEIVYRVFPLQNLSHLHPLKVIVFFAAVFSAMHFVIESPDAGRFFYRFFFGALAGLMYIRTRSLSSIVGLHTGWNFGALTLGTSGWKTGTLIYVSGIADSVEFMSNAAILGIASLGFYFYGKRDKSVV